MTIRAKVVIRKKKKCCKECADCLIASCDPCDPPEINKLLNVVYTKIPNLKFPDNGVLIPLGPTGYSFQPFNYYVSLPDEGSHEVRLLWPLVWMIPQLITRLSGRFSGSGPVTLKLNLNVDSKKLIKDPAQPVPTLNTGGPNNGPCICDTTGSAVFDYTFLFNVVNGSVDTGFTSSVIFSIPSNGDGSRIVFNSLGDVVLAVPASNTLLLSLLAPFTGAAAVALGAAGLNLLATLGVTPPVGTTAATLLQVTSPLPGILSFTFSGNVTGTVPNFVSATVNAGFIDITSPAHYISFIPSCEGDECDGSWFATYLETLRV